MTGETRLHIQTLGQFKITWGETEWQTFRTEKAKALLLYLALSSGVTHEREHLATLLWPDANKQAGRTNLRVAMLDLRKQWEKLSGQSWEVLFSTSRNSIKLQPHIVDCDLFSLNEALEETDDVKFEQLSRDIDLTAGDFLPGYGLGDSEQFDEWLYYLRDKVERQLGEAYERLSVFYGRNGEGGKSADFANRLLQLDNLREPSWQILFKSLGAANESQTLEQAYERCVQTFAEELGVEPSQETDEAYQEAQTLLGQQSTQRPTGNIESSQMPFFGRTEEIEKIYTDFRGHETRLITLLGVGGAGKSSLAKEVARMLQSNFADGIWFVSLAGSETNDFLTIVSDVLGINFHGGTNRLEQLVQALKYAHMLLVFDNFEDVIDESLLVSDLLAGTENLKILCTSRQSLDIREEWVIQLDGLDLPPVPANDVSQYSSVQLFVQRAQQANHRFKLTEENANVVADICRFVDGSPLGIELAAAWMRKQSAENLLATMKEMPDMLRTKRRDIPERQRSMRTIFDYSFTGLDKELQAMLLRLSLFSTSFTAEQAKIVAQASRLDLTELLENSLIQTAEKAYRLHPLVRSFSVDLLPSDSPSRIAFSQYFLSWVATKEGIIKDLKSNEAVIELSRAYENIVTAWRMAVKAELYDLLRDAFPTLLHFWVMRGQFEDGIHLLNDTLSTLGQSQEATSLHSYLESRLSGLFVRSGQFEKGLQVAQSAQESAEGESLGWINLVKGNVYRQRNHWELALSTYKKALAIFNEHENLIGSARCLSGMGILNLRAMKFTEAKQHFDESLRLSRIAGDAWDETDALLRLSIVTRRQNNLPESRQYGETALALCEKTDDLASQSGALNVLSEIAIDEKRYEDAYDLLIRANRINDQLNFVINRLFTTWYLGVALFKLGRLDESEPQLQLALDYARDMDDYIFWEAQIQLDMARLELSTDRRLRALDRVKRSLDIGENIDNDFLRESAKSLLAEIEAN